MLRPEAKRIYPMDSPCAKTVGFANSGSILALMAHLAPRSVLTRLQSAVQAQRS